MGILGSIYEVYKDFLTVPYQFKVNIRLKNINCNSVPNAALFYRQIKQFQTPNCRSLQETKLQAQANSKRMKRREHRRFNSFCATTGLSNEYYQFSKKLRTKLRTDLPLWLVQLRVLKTATLGTAGQIHRTVAPGGNTFSHTHICRWWTAAGTIVGHIISFLPFPMQNNNNHK